jgi:hypothetical protein
VVEAFGMACRKAIPVDHTPAFADLLAAIDKADLKAAVS